MSILDTCNRTTILVEAAQTLTERYAGDQQMDFVVAMLLREAASGLAATARTLEQPRPANDPSPPRQSAGAAC